MKKQNSLLKSIALLFILIGFSAIWPVSSQQIEVKANMAPITSRDGWKLFIDREVGYSFSYPSDAHIEMGKSELHPYNAVTILFRIPDVYGYHGMVFDVQKNIRRLNTLEYARTLWPANADIPDEYFSKAKMIEVGGMAALKIEIPPTLTDFTIIFPYQDKMFIIFPAGDPFMVDDPAKAEYLALFENVLATFRCGTNGGLQ